MVILTEPRAIPGLPFLKSLLGVKIEASDASCESAQGFFVSVHDTTAAASSSSEDESGGDDKAPAYVQFDSAAKCVLPHSARLTAYAAQQKVKGEPGSVNCFPLDEHTRVVVVGLGPANETASKAGELAGGAVYDADPEEVHVVAQGTALASEDARVCFLSRLLWKMASKSQQGYKHPSKADPARKLAKIVVHAPGLTEECANKVRAFAFASAFHTSLVDAPPNYCNCQTFVTHTLETLELVKKTVKGAAELEVEVLTEQDCAKEKMGAFLAVAQGSRHGARLLRLTYRGKASATAPPCALLGKGVTMDTGGYSIKPTASMSFMKVDMAGAAAVTSTLVALSMLAPEAVGEVHGLSVLCENMVDADAYRVGDIITASDGKTIEVLNTDAEGRLALADGLCYAQKLFGDRKKAATVIDCATLTGACLVGLGEELTAVFANEDRLTDDLMAASHRAGEPAWPMPLRAAYSKHLKTTWADLKNVGASPHGGSILAALFLKEFIHKGVNWAHLDIAGTSWDFEKKTSRGWGTPHLYYTVESIFARNSR